MTKARAQARAFCFYGHRGGTEDGLSNRSIHPAAEYLRNPSLIAYLVLSQDEPKVWLYIRTNSYLLAPELISGTEAAIHVKELNLDLPMAGIYAGTTAGSPPPDKS
jgi:hypothetical protein